MSVDSIREDFLKTTARSTIRERCQAIFNQELLSDVKFAVRDSQGGSESKQIPAHKFVLAISSPVFFAMFYGELAEKKDCVEISDCEYESLLEMFRFIYSDEAKLNPDNVMQLLYLAKKYMLPSLADKCSAYLQENLDASNVFHVLPNAHKYEGKDLLDQCWKVIDKETEEAVKSDGFVSIERSVLEELVEKDSLNIREVELFTAVDCWARKECEKQGLAAEGAVKRRILGERIIKGIRFPVMEQTEFADVVLDCDILTKRECFDMMKYFSSVLNTSVGFSKSKRSGWVSRPKTQDPSEQPRTQGGKKRDPGYKVAFREDSDDSEDRYRKKRDPGYEVAFREDSDDSEDRYHGYVRTESGKRDPGYKVAKECRNPVQNEKTKN